MTGRGAHAEVLLAIFFALNMMLIPGRAQPQVATACSINPTDTKPIQAEFGLG